MTLITRLLRLLLAVGVGCIVGCVPVAAVNDSPPGRDEPECDRDSDCSDGRFCNGAEHCERGACFDGAAPCSAGLCREDENRCASPPPVSVCIELGDVLNIPAGSARGSQFSGRYRLLTNFLLECTICPLDTLPDGGSCGPTPVDPTHEYEVTQTGGRLIFDDDEVHAVGGVNSDGSFTIGAVVTPTSDTGVRSGEGLALIEGRFDDTGFTATFTVRITANGPDNAEDILDAQGVSRVRGERTE